MILKCLFSLQDRQAKLSEGNVKSINGTMFWLFWADKFSLIRTKGQLTVTHLFCKADYEGDEMRWAERESGTLNLKLTKCHNLV